MKKNLLIKILPVLLLIFSLQVIETNTNTAKADDACIIDADTRIIDSSAARTSVRCTMPPETLRMFPYNLYVCTAEPAAPRVGVPIDLATSCDQIYSNPTGEGYADISSVGGISDLTAGTVSVPPAKIYTHVVLEAKNLMGIQGYFVSDDTTVFTGTAGIAGTANAAGQSCWTVAGTTRNSALANGDCGAALGAYGMSFVEMICFDDACAYSAAGDIDDNEYDNVTTTIPGSDWQMSAANSGTGGNVRFMSVTDSSGATRPTRFYFTLFADKSLCSAALCMSGTGVETGTAAAKSMFMVQELATPVGDTNTQPTRFIMNFKLETALLLEAVSGDTDKVSFRQGPMFLEFNLVYGN